MSFSKFLKDMSSNHNQFYSRLRIGLGSSSLVAMFFGITEYSKYVGQQENMTHIHDPESKLKRREINSEIPIYMQRIAEREMCQEHEINFSKCVRECKSRHGDNVIGINKLFEECKWARDNKHLCYKENYCNSDLYFRAKKQYMEYRQIYYDSGVLGRQRDAIHKGVAEERPTTEDQLPDDRSKLYFYDTIVRFGKQSYYNRFEELRVGILKAEERAKSKVLPAIEKLYPEEKFEPYFTSSPSKFANSNPNYAKTVQELKDKRVVNERQSISE